MNGISAQTYRSDEGSSQRAIKSQHMTAIFIKYNQRNTRGARFGDSFAVAMINNDTVGNLKQVALYYQEGYIVQCVG